MARPTRVNFFIDIPGTREEVLDRRDEIVDALEPLGLRLSMTDCGTDVYLVDRGVPTVGDVVTGQGDRSDTNI